MISCIVSRIPMRFYLGSKPSKLTFELVLSVIVVIIGKGKSRDLKLIERKGRPRAYGGWRGGVGVAAGGSVTKVFDFDFVVCMIFRVQNSGARNGILNSFTWQ